MKYMPAHMVSSHDARYAYAAGRIRALEIRLLGRQRLERMAEAGDLDEALRLLSDTVYAANLEEVEEGGYERFIRTEERELLELIDSLSLDKDVSDVLRMRYDFHNLKVALRAQVSGRDLGDLFVDLGTYDPEVIAAAVKAESLDLLPEDLTEAAGAAAQAYERTQDPAAIDMAVDRAMFEVFLGRVRKYGSIYAEAIVKTWIDLANIRTFMRARYLDFESRILGGLLIGGGTIRPSDFTETFQLPLEEVLQRFEFSPYRSLIEIGGSSLERADSFAAFEREIDSHLVRFLRLSRYFTFGLEIVLAYALLKENEIKTLGLILAAKTSGMPVESIKERIPDAE
jgi:V/A-type H+-transporting ATPase subunit C